jgi:hypothetical protein
MVFYYVHPACLYINKFRVAGLLDEGIDQYVEQVGLRQISTVCAHGQASGAHAGTAFTSTMHLQLP